jgi:hypothetical protein
MAAHSLIPDLFVIGAMKGGTSTLYRNVLVHEEIDRTRRKEVNFFLKDEPVAILESRYKNQFDRPELIKCDVSPKYSQYHSHAGVAERIFQANAAAKIIYIVRDPVDRAISHLHHNLLRDRYKEKEMESEIRRNPDYIMVSKYFEQVSLYLQCFPKNQIMVVMLEELITRPDAFIAKLGAFIGVNSPLTFKKQKFNVSERRYKIKYYDFVHDHIRSGPLIKLYHYFWLFMNVKCGKPELSQQARNFLYDALKDDVGRLVDNFGLDVNLWPNFSK